MVIPKYSLNVVNKKCRYLITLPYKLKYYSKTMVESVRMHRI